MRADLQEMPEAGRHSSRIGTGTASWTMPTRRRWVLAGLALLALALAGCAEQPRTIAETLHPGPPIVQQTRVDVLTVHVPDNARPLGANSSTAGALLTLLPLVPYGTQHISPETQMRDVERQPYDFLDDLGRSVTADLVASGVAHKVVYSADEAAGHAGPHLYLTVREAEWNRHVTAYGLSLAGDFLWFLGAPVSYGEVDLSVEAELRDTSGNQIAQKVFSSSVPFTNYLYNPHGYTNRLPSLYQGLSSPLRKFVAENLKQL